MTIFIPPFKVKTHRGRWKHKSEVGLLYRHPFTDTNSPRYSIILLLKITAYSNSEETPPTLQNKESMLPSLALTCKPWAIANHLSMLTSRTNISAVRAKDLKCSEVVFQHSSNTDAFILNFHIAAFQMRVLTQIYNLIIIPYFCGATCVSKNIQSSEKFVEMSP